MRRFLAFAAAALLSVPALAEQPWLEAGDMQARQDVETLKAARFIKGPIEGWPLPWSQIDEGVQAALATRTPAFVRAAANRLNRLGDRAEQRNGGEVRIGGTNRAATIRGFDWTAREQADVSVRVTRSLGRLFISSGIGYRSGQSGSDIHFEPGYAAATFGNWAVYGGYVEKYWGVGYDGALQIGNAARPFPKVGVQRLYPYRPEPKFLRWVGPWRFDAFGGVLTEKRLDGDGPAYIGTRFSMEPVRGLELNFTRTLLTCGGGGTFRPPDFPNPVAGGQCSPGSIVRAIIPLFPGSKPGDSLAGISISYIRPVGPVLARLYYDAEGEDKAGEQQFEQVGQTGGVMLTGGLGQSGASWTLVGEYTDTLANFLFQSDVRPGSFYSNTFYFTGKYFRGDSIGHPIGGDSNLVTVSASVTDSMNRRWYAAYRDADLNFTEATTLLGTPANTIFPTRTTTTIVTAGTEWPTPIGDLRVEGRYMTDRPNTPGRDAPSGEFELSWRTRF